MVGHIPTEPILLDNCWQNIAPTELEVELIENCGLEAHEEYNKHKNGGCKISFKGHGLILEKHYIPIRHPWDTTICVGHQIYWTLEKDDYVTDVFSYEAKANLKQCLQAVSNQLLEAFDSSVQSIRRLSEQERQ